MKQLGFWVIKIDKAFNLLVQFIINSSKKHPSVWKFNVNLCSFARSVPSKVEYYMQ